MNTFNTGFLKLSIGLPDTVFPESLQQMWQIQNEKIPKNVFKDMLATIVDQLWRTEKSRLESNYQQHA